MYINIYSIGTAIVIYLPINLLWQPPTHPQCFWGRGEAYMTIPHGGVMTAPYENVPFGSELTVGPFWRCADVGFWRYATVIATFSKKIPIIGGLCSFKCKYYIHIVHTMYMNQKTHFTIAQIYYITYHVSLTLVSFWHYNNLLSNYSYKWYIET